MNLFKNTDQSEKILEQNPFLSFTLVNYHINSYEANDLSFGLYSKVLCVTHELKTSKELRYSQMC